MSESRLLIRQAAVVILIAVLTLLAACVPVGDPLDLLEILPLPTSTTDPEDAIMDILENPPAVEEDDQGLLDLKFELLGKRRENCTDMLGGDQGRQDFCDESVYGLVYVRLEGSGRIVCTDFFAETILETSVSEEEASLQIGVSHEGIDTFYYGNEVLLSCTLTTDDDRTASVTVTHGEVDWDEESD